MGRPVIPAYKLCFCDTFTATVCRHSSSTKTLAPVFHQHKSSCFHYQDVVLHDLLLKVEAPLARTHLFTGIVKSAATACCIDCWGGGA